METSSMPGYLEQPSPIGSVSTREGIIVPEVHGSEPVSDVESQVNRVLEYSPTTDTLCTLGLVLGLVIIVAGRRSVFLSLSVSAALPALAAAQALYHSQSAFESIWLPVTLAFVLWIGTIILFIRMKWLPPALLLGLLLLAKAVFILLLISAVGSLPLWLDLAVAISGLLLGVMLGIQFQESRRFLSLIAIFTGAFLIVNGLSVWVVAPDQVMIMNILRLLSGDLESEFRNSSRKSYSELYLSYLALGGTISYARHRLCGDFGEQEEEMALADHDELVDASPKDAYPRLFGNARV